MFNQFLKIKYILFFILYIFLIRVSCQETSFSYETEYAKAFKLINGYIIIVGTDGINIYDNTGQNSINNIPMDEEDKITQIPDSFYTTFAQFDKGQEYVLLMVKQVLYIMNSQGGFIFKNKFTNHDTTLTKFYSLVPFINQNNNYNFILGYITNERKKAFLEYYTINFESQILTLIGDYIFDKDDPSREYEAYDYGITCQIMDHYTKGYILTCFYFNYNPEGIYSISFTLEDNGIVKIPMFNATYNDKPYILQSIISPDKKKSLLCYVRNKDSNDHFVYCVIYNVDENKFENLNKYLSQISCGETIENIALYYFKETTEYIVTCTNSELPEIDIIKFDQNFDVIKIDSDKNDSTISMDTGCSKIYFYSFLFLSNEYKLFAQFYCDNSPRDTRVYSLPNEYEPRVINPDSPGIKDTDENTIESDTKSSIDSSFQCDYYKNNEGTICSEIVPNGYYILDIINKIIEKCHISCNTCENGPIDNNNNNCASCKENFELNINNNCIYKYNYYFDNIIEKIIYLLPDQLCPEKLPYEIIETKECVEYCTNEEFIHKICKINKLTEKNIDIITAQLKSIINEITDSDYDVIIDGNNIIYEVTTTSANNDHQNISLIDFGECEKLLKKKHNIDYLLVFKMDVKLNETYPTYVEYEVYSPESKTKLDLSICEDTQIDIYVPLNLDNNTIDLYNSMSKNGIDILDQNDSFYNDICLPFTSDDGTDMTLNDRQDTFYNDSIPLCENNCNISLIIV